MGALPAGPVGVEARAVPALRDALRARGWVDDEPWQPLSRDLVEPVDPCDLRVVIGTAATAADRTRVHRAAFGSPRLTPERWATMAQAPAYARARCLIGHDAAGAAVAAATVWSAGEGRPGLLEPLGVHPDHRGRGHGRAMCLAAAAVLREMGASSIDVATPAANTAAVATYVAAGFRPLPVSRDVTRRG